MIALPHSRTPAKSKLDGRRCSHYGAGVNNTKNSEPELEPGVKIKDVVGYEGLYKVTDDGRVWSCARQAPLKKGGSRTVRPRWLKPAKTKRSYLTLALTRDAKCKTFTVHSLVAAAFIGPRPDGHDIDHLDRDPYNNAASNLRYALRSENLHNGGAKGYGYCKVTGKWEARISHNNKKVSLGRFDTPEEARAAYVAAKQKLGVPNF